MYSFADDYAQKGYPNGVSAMVRTLVADSADDLATMTTGDNSKCAPGSTFIVATTDSPIAMKAPSGTWEWL